MTSDSEVAEGTPAGVMRRMASGAAPTAGPPKQADSGPDQREETGLALSGSTAGRRTRPAGQSEPERRHIAVQSAIGGLIVVATESAIVGVYHEGHDPAPGEALLGRRVEREEAARVNAFNIGVRTLPGEGESSTDLLVRACGQLLEYLDGRRQVFDVPFCAHGTAFQRGVWDAIGQVTFGQRCSYRDIAAALGNPRMGRAIGAAVRANPLSILIPGHRVVGTSGAITGYAAGTEVKSALLDLEQSSLPEGDPSVGSHASNPTESRARTSTLGTVEDQVTRTGDTGAIGKPGSR